MSCEVEIRPVPIAPTFIRLLGAFFPNTLAGTMLGKFANAMVPAVALRLFFKNFLREEDTFDFFIWSCR
jgi:hypothetical protein